MPAPRVLQAVTLRRFSQGLRLRASRRRDAGQ